MTEVILEKKSLLEDGKFQEYYEQQKSLEFNINDIKLSFKCRDADLLESILCGFDLPIHVITSMLKFHIITEEENEVLVQVQKRFGMFDDDTLLEIAFDEKSMSAISWCMRNIDPDDDVQGTFGRGVDDLDESDKVIILEILESLEGEDNYDNVKPSRKWWRAIVNHSHKWDDAVEEFCPFGPDTLTASSSSSSSQEEEIQ